MIVDGITTRLLADSGVKALIGTRLYAGALPRTYSFPAVASHIVTHAVDYDFNGPTGLDSTTLQFDSYGADYTTARNVANAISNSLQSFVGTLPDNTVVQAAYVEQDLDLPFVPNVDTKGITFHTVLQIRFVHHQ